MSEVTRGACPVCDGPAMKVFVEIEHAAVLSNVLWHDRDSAQAAPTAGISLGFCGDCGMLYNVDFDPDLLQYTQNYENALDYSPRFRTYADQLARRLVRTYDLHNKDIVEIGCGQGGFLALLAMLGDNRAVGYDPSYDLTRASAETRAVTAISSEYFSRAHAGRPTDLVCCRHVLEHIPNPYEFLCDVRSVLDGRDESVLYVEVPNGLHMLRKSAIWDIIYEHCSYYTPQSLGRLLERAGFEVLMISEQYGGQFLGVEARPRLSGRVADVGRWVNPPEFGSMVRRFQQEYAEKVDAWSRRLGALADRSSKTVVWGAGSKGITFLNVLGAGPGQVEYVVDLNPHKHGRFVTGAGQEIVAPTHMAGYQPAAVIIMNPLYRDEIAQSLAEMHVAAEVLEA